MRVLDRIFAIFAATKARCLSSRWRRLRFSETIGGGIAADTGSVSSDDGRRSLARLGPIYFSRS